MTDMWFQSDNLFDGSWHRAINTCYAAGGVFAHYNLTWRGREKAGHRCRDCDTR